MADDSKQSLPNIGGNGFIWILVAAATTYFVAHQIPLEGSRPARVDVTGGRSLDPRPRSRSSGRFGILLRGLLRRPRERANQKAGDCHLR